MSSLWTEKYRPKTVETFEGPEYLKSFLIGAKTKGFPNLLLYGPPGTGKTTFAHLLAKDKLELNASDERGISVIRNKIKSYASTLKEKKTVILDECENLTTDAQHCLRRIIEDCSHTNFIFITNYPAKVIPPLKSRLVKIRFKISKNNALEKIGEMEGLKHEKEWYEKLFSLCNNDLRRSINVLQGMAPLANADLNNLVGVIPEKVLKDFWAVGKNEISAYIREFLKNGYSALQLIYQVNKNMEGTDLQKAKLYKNLSFLEAKAIKGCSDEFVLYNLIMNKIEVFQN